MLQRPNQAIRLAFPIFLLAGSTGGLLLNRVSQSPTQRICPGFVESNLSILRKRSSQSPGKLRDSAIATAKANLEWAHQYDRYQVDPEIWEELKFQRELAHYEEELVPTVDSPPPPINGRQNLLQTPDPS